MNRKQFAEIIEKLNRGENPELKITVGDETYIRRFIYSDRLILLGGGHVSYDVYRMALLLDFKVTVVDDRPDFANNGRFPEAEVICSDFASALDSLNITEHDFVCVLTRGHRWDKLCVERILSGVMPYYLGMIGSRRRVAGLKEDLTAQGYAEERLSQLHAPIGLSINASTTAEIALSICGEMIAEKRQVRYSPADGELSQTSADDKMLSCIADSAEPSAVLVVLSSTGSTPVKSGSMMAVNRLGKGYGTIGGGCSEAAAIAKARRIIGTGTGTVINIDMTNEVAADNGMVCGGEMSVYIEDIS